MRGNRRLLNHDLDFDEVAHAMRKRDLHRSAANRMFFFIMTSL